MPEEQAQILGHRPGEGCDFCDNLRVERAHLDAAIAEQEQEEEEEEEEGYGGEEEYAIGELDSVAETEIGTGTRDYPDGYSESVLLSYPDDSQTVRAMREESIITQYMTSPPQPPPSSSSSSTSRLSTSSSSSTLINTKTTSVYGFKPRETTGGRRIREQAYGEGKGGRGDYEEEEGRRMKTASEWARSYGDLVERM